ncbi:DUF6279 family lipoprotein [Salinimonas lutimaris]|uniref:DUF6279 family lipoprotein n=1 Tax=Salinimonas lutimaris TaxID=914153 RepID=UPI0010BFE30E|nr:DUF6279 family lipoprotein [Salinimonas lutimaris]
MKLWGLVLIALLVVTGCSSKLAYNNLDWLVYWYMDDYVELTDSQEEVFDKQLDQWINWHKSQELDQYLHQLRKLRMQAAGNKLDEPTIAWHLNQASDHIDRLRNKLAPQLSSMAATLNDEQVIYLFAAIEKENRERQEEQDEKIKDSREEWENSAVDNIQEEFEERVGELNNQQMQIIRARVPHFTSTFDNWMAYRRNMQTEARKLFATRHTNPDFVAELTHLLTHPDAYRSKAYLEQRQNNREAYLAMSAELAASMTPAQKKHLLNYLDDLIDDVEELKD